MKNNSKSKVKVLICSLGDDFLIDMDFLMRNNFKNGKC